MAENGVVPLEPARLETTTCEDLDVDQESDESAPLSPTPQNGTSYGSAWPAAVDTRQLHPPDQTSTDDIDPFTFVPTFRFWHKLLVSVES